MTDDIYSFLGQTVEVRVDRPIGYRHPKYDFIYPVNYGHLPETSAPDNNEIDVYVLGVDKPLEGFFQGKAIAVIHRTDDNDDKLIVIPETSDGISDNEIRRETGFQEQHYNSVIIREKHE